MRETEREGGGGSSLCVREADMQQRQRQICTN